MTDHTGQTPHVAGVPVAQHRDPEIRERDAAALGAVYLDSHLELALPTGTITLRPRSDGSTPGILPPGLPDGTRTVHVITACNPSSVPLSPLRNTERNRMLAAALAAQGLSTIPALGRSPDGRWQEPGHAVLDGDIDQVRTLARRFGQHAVFELTVHHLAVRWTDPHLACPQRGWDMAGTSGYRDDPIGP